jgi:hypothetical protein
MKAAALASATVGASAERSAAASGPVKGVASAEHSGAATARRRAPP